jgi:hypothetical protein
MKARCIMRRAVVGIFLLVGLAGCDRGGDVHALFDDVPINNQLPKNLKDRNLFDDPSGLYKFNPAELVGWVVNIEPDAKVYVFRKFILAPGYAPIVKSIPEKEGKLFDATIDKGADVSASYLSFAAAFDAKQVATVSIRDWANIFVKNNDVPWDALVREAAVPKENPATGRYWIQGALLTSVDASIFQEANANAKFAGPTFGANGKVFSKSSEEVHDNLISVQILDIDGLAKELNAPAMTGLSTRQRIQRVMSDSTLIEKIRPKVAKVTMLTRDPKFEERLLQRGFTQ